MAKDSHHHNVPPHSEDAEQSVLGAILRDNHALEKVKGILRAQDFYLERHQVIYSAMLEMSDAGIPIDIVTLGDHLQTGGQFESAGKTSHLCTVLGATPTAENARHYAAIIKDKTKRRKAQEMISWLQEIVTNDHGPEEELEAVLSVFLRDVRQGPDQFPALKKVKEQAMETAEHLNDNMKGLPTGFAAFDHKLSGLRGITLLGAPPKVGKSVFALNVALNVAKQGGAVHYYDIENGMHFVMLRLLSNFYSKTFEQLRAEKDHAERWEADLAGKVPKFHLCTDYAQMKPDLIARHAQRVGAEKTLIVLDSLQKLPPLAKQRRDSLDAWLRELEQIKQDPSITILLISELSRGEKEAHYKNPSLGAFKESGDIEYTADVALQFLKDEKGSKHMVLHCVANRHGKSGKIAKYSYENFKYWRWTEVPN
ncbi:AAA family ATPase [Nitrospinae bacterium AH_259_B05_G02_I21]|nr:AAA family ATPase [Nitrospinae bacterium AH_259_B05_G02_I21]MDA2932437.1 AAA family ATPase [Nitrospinae bacterium AH-259-F20]